MDAAVAPAVGSEATAGTNRVELSTADASAHVSRRYQPLVAVTLAVAAGIVWDRYGPQHFFDAAVDSIRGSLWFVIWWCACPRPTPLRAIPVGERSRLPIKLTGIRDGAQWRPASGVCQLSVEGHLLGVHQGDHLRIFGQLARISPQQNPGEFDFAAHAEAQPPVVRAAVFGVLMCVANWSGRRGVGFNSIFAAALVVIAINPNDLFSAGPQLSFLAVAALIWVGMWIERRHENPDRLDEMIAASRPWPVRLAKWTWTRVWVYWLLLCTVLWLTMLPLVLYQFHIVSPISILISPAIWLVVFVAMWSGFFMVAAGWIAPVIGATFAAVCNWSLDWLERVVHWAESVHGGHAWLAGPAWWWVAGFYVGLLAVMIWGRAITPPRWQLAGLATWILVGLTPFMTRGWTRSGLDCTVVAVGHGECVLLQGPGGETLLYDAGGIGSPEYATQSVASVLWDRGITHIDGIIISHSDTDHYNAIPGLLERFNVGTVYVSTVMFRSIDDTDRGPKVLLDAIHSAGVPIREIWSGDRLHVGPDVTVQVLHPPQKGVVGSDNANSVTLGVEYAGRRILLPGDLESPGIDDVMAEAPYDCDVLLAPHHGSRRSDPPGFSAWSTPEWVVLSGGGGEQAAPVIHTYEEAGADVLVTNDVGAVQFKVQPDSQLQMATFRPRKQSPAAIASEP